ncbi:MAG: hydroxyphenylacetyl-CoA thioesterase PaaI [Candidatus Margulisbacteria bacterium]|nr:hydroxyphenylacetyl-CoA thioesterase PaaI [Candidatus Margulisiibacteriota bacterium]
MEENIKQKLKDFFYNDEFARTSGISIIDMSEGYGKTAMIVEKRHLNGVRIVQGGAVFTLADLAFALASNSRGNVSVGLNNYINYIKPAFKGDILTAEATEVSRGRTIGTYEVKITNQKGELVATFQGTSYIKKDILF